MKGHWTTQPIALTFQPDGLFQLRMSSGSMEVETAGAGSPAPLRVAVQGSNAVWTVVRSRRMMNLPRKVPALRFFSIITRFDFDAPGDEAWQTRLMVDGHSANFMAQNGYGWTNLIEDANFVRISVNEYGQWGQGPKSVFTAEAATLLQLRAEHPDEFRFYVLPILAKFVDPSLILPGPADVYAAFTEIPADPAIVRQVRELLPGLDADDPVERDAASARLHDLAHRRCWRYFGRIRATSRKNKNFAWAASYPNSAIAATRMSRPSDRIWAF